MAAVATIRRDLRPHILRHIGRLQQFLELVHPVLDFQLETGAVIPREAPATHDPGGIGQRPGFGRHIAVGRRFFGQIIEDADRPRVVSLEVVRVGDSPQRNHRELAVLT